MQEKWFSIVERFLSFLPQLLKPTVLVMSFAILLQGVFLAFSLIATSHPPALHSNRVRLCRKGVLPRDKSGLCLWLLEVTSRSLFTLQGMGLGAHWMVCANNVTSDEGFGSSACPSLWAGDYGQSCLWLRPRKTLDTKAPLSFPGWKSFVGAVTHS